MKELIILVVIYLILANVSDVFLKRKYKIRRKGNELAKRRKRLQRLVLITMFLLYFVVVIIVIVKYENFNVVHVVLPYIIIVAFIQGIVQRVFNKQADIWRLDYNQGMWSVLFYIALLVFSPYPVF